MKQIIVLSVFFVVAFIQLINAEHTGLDSEDLGSISSAEIIRDLERLRNERSQNEFDSNGEQIPSEPDTLKQKRGRQCLWKVCSWHLEKEKIKNAIAKNRIPEIKSKINSDRMIALLNMNRF